MTCRRWGAGDTGGGEEAPWPEPLLLLSMEKKRGKAATLWRKEVLGKGVCAMVRWGQWPW